MPVNALMQPRIDGTMQATPRNALMGYIADALNAANSYANKPDRSMPMGKANPVLGLLSSALGVGDLAATADNLSYGRNLTQGQGMARQMLPETANALMTMGPVAAKFPRQVAAGAAGLMSGDMNAAKAAMVWHGSPHKFDKFDSSKIGTGEGAQAYGHGLYLAEAKPVAEEYAGKLSRNLQVTVDGVPFSNSSLSNDAVAKELADEVLKRAWPMEYDARLSPGMDFLRSVANKQPRTTPITEGWGMFQKTLPAHSIEEANSITRRAEAAKMLLKSINIDDGSSLYKVDLPDSAISRMLDWDKPVSEAQRAPLSQSAMKQFGSGLSGTSGEHLYKEVLFEFKNAGHPNPAAAATEWLRKNGAPGIRYLDGGSRGAGSGSSNFVVFPGEENILQILERNGVPLK